MTVVGRLSRREKVLLSMLFLVALPLALWTLVLAPLQEARDRAIGTLAGAQADYVWVAEKAQEFSPIPDTGAEPQAQAAGIAGIETALIEIGLRETVTALEAVRGGGIRLQLKEVRFDTLGRFLDAAAYRLGYTMTELRIVPAAQTGHVDANIALEPR